MSPVSRENRSFHPRLSLLKAYRVCDSLIMQELHDKATESQWEQELKPFRSSDCILTPARRHYLPFSMAVASTEDWNITGINPKHTSLR